VPCTGVVARAGAPDCPDTLNAAELTPAAKIRNTNAERIAVRDMVTPRRGLKAPAYGCRADL
jgi:hypothetical protein